MVDSKIAYGYEYVANYSPAVRTPLTERCYRSFFLAVEYNYGKGKPVRVLATPLRRVRNTMVIHVGTSSKLRLKVTSGVHVRRVKV